MAGRKSPPGARVSSERRKIPARAGKNQPAQQPPDPEVRMDKVEKIREALQRGEYNVPASKVAAKILEDMRRQ